MINNNKLYVLVGAPGSGKSTYANKNLKNDNTIILSSDELRQELLGDVNNQENNRLVFTELFKRMRKALFAGKDVVIDATNINKAVRFNILKRVKGLNILRIALVFKTDIQTCYAYDASRTRTVGKQVIDKFFKLYEEPTIEEGFDEVRFV